MKLPITKKISLVLLTITLLLIVGPFFQAPHNMDMQPNDCFNISCAPIQHIFHDFTLKQSDRLLLIFNELKVMDKTEVQLRHNEPPDTPPPINHSL